MSGDLQRRAPGLVLFLGFALFVGVRLSVFDIDVPNPDIAGILYNADGLLRGELPYRDIVEIKPPGAFVLVAGIFGVFGRSIDALHWAHSAWLLLGAPAIWIAAASRGRLAAAIATAVYLFYVGMFSYNYSSWMIVPYAWSFAAMQRGLDTGARRWSIGAGAAATFAVLTIQRAAVLAPLALVLWVLARRRGAPGGRPITLAWWVLGATATFAVVAMPWALGGALPEFLAGTIPLGVGRDYAGAADGSFVTTIVGAAWQLVETFIVGLAVVGLAFASRVLDRPVDEEPVDPFPAAALLFLAASILGAALGGGRFYLHYLVQYVPALAVLAAFRPTHRAVVVLSVLALLLAVAEVATGRAHRYEARARRLENGQTAAQAAGRHIAARTSPDDTIFGWGWTSWPVYFWADRRATAGVYKSLGTFTTFNRNTSFEPGSGIEFRPGPAADAFIEAFDRAPPAYVVLSPSDTQAFGARVEPVTQWTALAHRLARDYRPEALYGDLTLLRRVAP